MSAWTSLGRRSVVAALIAGLAACATPPSSVPQDHFWSGRLALRIESDPAQSMTAAFELRGDPHHGELALLSPLGQTVAVARWNAMGAALQQGTQETTYASMADLTEQLTGAALPLPALFLWLQGQPVAVPGWSADLSGHAEGRIVAQRLSPAPRAELRIRLQP